MSRLVTGLEPFVHVHSLVMEHTLMVQGEKACSRWYLNGLDFFSHLESNSLAQYSLPGAFGKSSYISSTDLSNLEFD